MTRFLNAKEAKEYLVDQIVDEALREGVPLSELERKMLYFSETYWTLPDIMKVNADFERQYDTGQYEKKIAGLIQKRLQREKGDPQFQKAWRGAVQQLRKEDHYILAMLPRADVEIRSLTAPGVRWVIVAGITAAIVTSIAFEKFNPPRAGRPFGSYTVNLRTSVIMGYFWLAGVVAILLLSAVTAFGSDGWLTKRLFSLIRMVLPNRQE